MRPEDGAALAALQRASCGRAGAGLRAAWPEADALDAAGLTAFLGASRFAVLATSRPDGRPQARPVGFSVRKGAFWVASVAGQRLVFSYGSRSGRAGPRSG